MMSTIDFCCSAAFVFTLICVRAHRGLRCACVGSSSVLALIKQTFRFLTMSTIRVGWPTLAIIAGLVVGPLSGASAQGNQASSTASQNPAVAAFIADPASLLTRYPLGGGLMVAEVRDLVVADLGSVKALLGLATSATPDQKNAIGTGMGLAALVLLRTNPQAASVIQSALVALNDPAVLAAYAAVTGNQRLTAAGPGAGGGGGGESATTPGGANGGIGGTSALFPNFSTINVGDVFTIPGFTASGPGTPTNTTNNSVSPSAP